MTITEKYLQMVLKHHAAIFPNQSVKEVTINGLIGYEFPCPFCSMMCDKESSRNKRCAYLLPQKESFSWVFKCHRHKTNECQTSRSFPNFLAMLNQDLFNKYQIERFHSGTTGKGHNIANPKLFKKP